MGFKVGDTVRIRPWDDMRREFLQNQVGDILCDGSAIFVEQMKELCGTEFSITEIVGDRVYGCPDDRWAITKAMIEHVDFKGFHIGDLVRVRNWEDMEREFGLRYDAIPCTFSFVKEMIPLIGSEFTITGIASDGNVEGLTDKFDISTDMLEKVLPDDMEIAPSDGLDLFLKEYFW